jgi:hypothetical protein
MALHSRLVLRLRFARVAPPPTTPDHSGRNCSGESRIGDGVGIGIGIEGHGASVDPDADADPESDPEDMRGERPPGEFQVRT